MMVFTTRSVTSARHLVEVQRLVLHPIDASPESTTYSPRRRCPRVPDDVHRSFRCVCSPRSWSGARTSPSDSPPWAERSSGSVQNRTRPSLNTNTRRGSSSTITNAYTRKSNLYPSGRVGSGISAPPPRWTRAYRPPSACRGRAGLWWPDRCSGKLGCQFPLAPGARFEDERAVGIPPVEDLNCSAKMSISAGRMNVLGAKVNSSGNAADIRARFFASCFLRQISSMPVK